jgi:Putative MetA-pathway of phenol degradation
VIEAYRGKRRGGWGGCLRQGSSRPRSQRSGCGLIQLGRTEARADFYLNPCRLLVLIILATAYSFTQELEPRAYSPSPVGTTFVVVSYGRSSGDVSLDPSIPITNVHAGLNSGGLGLGQTFALFGRQALVTVGLPYAWGKVTGQVGEQSGFITRSGLADIKTRFSVNLYGTPALTPKEFAALRRRSPIVAASLTVTSPSGQYDPTKLINLGTNRWAFKPEIGVSYPVKKFDLDFYFGAWLFTDNPHFYPGDTSRSEDVLSSAQAHVSYTFRRNLWCAFDSTWYGGGATRIDNGPASERQNNSRLGATVSLPFMNRQSLKIAYSSGVTAEIGSSFTTVSVSWQYIWFDRH